MTYREISETHKKEFGKSIKTCWIADVKRQLGYHIRYAYNRKGNDVMYPCPDKFVDSITTVIHMLENK